MWSSRGLTHPSRCPSVSRSAISVIELYMFSILCDPCSTNFCCTFESVLICRNRNNKKRGLSFSGEFLSFLRIARPQGIPTRSDPKLLCPEWFSCVHSGCLEVVLVAILYFLSCRYGRRVERHRCPQNYRQETSLPKKKGLDDSLKLVNKNLKS